MKYSCREYKKQKLQQRGCSRGLCCSCRISVSSSEETDSSSSCGARFGSISSLSHAMVQERLEQMIRGRQEEASKSERRRLKKREGSTKFVVMVAMEKCSYDPREDFRESIVEMIMANRMEDPKDLRRLLNYYMSMNSQDYHGIILEVFHESQKEHLELLEARVTKVFNTLHDGRLTALYSLSAEYLVKVIQRNQQKIKDLGIKWE